MTRSRLLPLLLVGVGFALRVLALGAQSLWYDEGVSAWLAAQPPEVMVRWTAADIQPPMYYLLLSLWSGVAGHTEFSLRFLSAAAGTLAVPLLFALVRRWAGTGPGLWAAALAALHPVLIYYAQEARVYALLVALGILMVWILTPSFAGPMPWRRWLAYAAAAALAAYSHYFAFFLVAALGFAWWIEWRAHRTGAGRWAAAHALLLILYAPWVAVMVNRWAVDASYWQGRLKLGEAVRGVATRFTSGETLREQPAAWIALALLLATAAGVVWLWRSRMELRPLLRLALLWLLVPVAAGLALATAAPKFNPRYVLMALPGLLILWALALDALARSPQRVRRALGAAAAAALLLTFAVPTWNWFANNAYSKAHWRQLTEFLRPRLDPNEKVILVSGHAWPVWEYYAPDIPALRLPAIDVLDVNHVLTFEETGGPLRETILDDEGAWLVGWQDEVIDPNEVVPVQLEMGGREKGSTATFNQLSLRRWSRIRLGRIADSPPISVTVGVELGGQVRLEGYRPLDNGDLLLFWSKGAAAGAQADYHMAVEVVGADGGPEARVPDRRLGGYTYPTFRWRPGEVVMGRIPAAEWLGPEPKAGRHTLRIGIYDAARADQARLLLADGSDTLVVPDVQSILE